MVVVYGVGLELYKEYWQVDVEWQQCEVGIDCVLVIGVEYYFVEQWGQFEVDVDGYVEDCEDQVV